MRTAHDVVERAHDSLLADALLYAYADGLVLSDRIEDLLTGLVQCPASVLYVLYVPRAVVIHHDDSHS